MNTSLEHLGRTLFETCEDAVFVVDPARGVVDDANPAAIRLTGIDPLCGRPIDEFVDAESDAARPLLRAALRGEATLPWQNGFLLRLPGGDVRCRMCVTRLSAEPNAGVLLSVRDLREPLRLQEQLAESQAELQRVISSAPDYLWSAEVDANGKFRYRFYSDSVSRLTGRPPEFYQGGPEKWLSTIHPEDRPRLEKMRVRIETRQVDRATEHYRVIWPDGTIRWLCDRVTAVPSANGTMYLYDLVTDVTEEHEREAALHESSKSLQQLFHAAPLAFYSLDLDGKIRSWNPACARIYGWSAEEVLGQPLPTIPLGKEKEVADLLERIHHGESILAAEVERQHRDGTRVLVSLSSAPLYDEHGHISGVLAVVDDITARKQVEETLQTQARILDSMAEGVNVSDEQAVIRFTNIAFDRMFGYERGELIGQHLSMLNHLPPDDNARFVHSIVDSLQSQRSWVGDIPNRRKDGTTFLTRAHISALDVAGQKFWISVQEDVTERRHDVEALREAEAKFHSIFEHAAEGIYQTMVDGRVLTANPMMAWIFGYSSPDELLMDNLGNSHLYVDERRRPEFIRQVVERGSVVGFESQIRRKDGTIIWVSENARSVSNGAGQVLYFEGTIVDITERKMAEEALSRQHALLRSLLNSLPDLIALKDVHGVYRRCNVAFAQYVSRGEHDIIGHTDNDLFPRALAEMREQSDRQVLAESRLVRAEEWLEYPNGRRVLVEELKTPFFGSDGRIVGIIVIQRDISERRRLEDQLRHAQKMEAIGQLAGGVAHDFNNLLTVILGNVALLQSGLDDPAQVRELLTAIERSGWSAADLVRQLLGFSRQSVLCKQPTPMPQIVDDVASFLRRIIDPRIHLQVRAEPSQWAVHADPAQMKQMVMNLCLNARDAMPDGGDLILESGNVVVGTEALTHSEARAGEFVRLSIRDTGVGIAPEIHRRIFEPFFTTKPFGQGTGLGLALVFGIVQQHEGWIECQSELGKGTNFGIFLPRFRQQTAEGLALCAPEPPDKHEATILLVDDEPMIRDLGRIYLERLGYRVLQAADGRQALDVFERERENLHLVILDLVMPDLSGREVFRRLRQIDPAVPVLFSSGYSTEQIIEGEEEGVLGFIAKPYHVHDLAQSVQRALARVAERSGQRARTL